MTPYTPSKLTCLCMRLANELAHDKACENALYPEAVFVQDLCAFPAGMIQQVGDRCDLDIVPGCTDLESPFFDPLANVDDRSCPYISDGENYASSHRSVHLQICSKLLRSVSTFSECNPHG